MKEIPEELRGHLVSTPDTLSGAVRFQDTRVFAWQLIDYLLNGRSTEEFLADFPGVSSEAVEAVQAWTRARILSEFDAA
jgi:uncharacterized protein (DUF433 family)